MDHRIILSTELPGHKYFSRLNNFHLTLLALSRIIVVILLIRISSAKRSTVQFIKSANMYKFLLA